MNNFKKIRNRCNKLFNDYKVKQMMLNDLQQRYLFIEGEKYTFFPIIKNYIIKYNRPYFPSLPKSEMNNQENLLNYNNYFNNLNSTSNYNSINNFTSISEDTLFLKNKSSKKTYHKKKNGLISTVDNISKNKIFKKIKNYNLTNTNRYNGNPRKNNYNNYYLYEHTTNIYPRMNITNGLSLKDNSSSNYKRIIQKTNSIKSLISNNSQNNKKSKINKLHNKKKDMNNIIKINIPLEEINTFNYNYNINLNKKPYLNTINSISQNSNSSSNHYINKSKDILNKYKKLNSNNYEGLSLKYLIQDVKLKNKSNLKQSINISKEKTNQILNNVFNYHKKLKNSLKINIDDNNLDLNENPNNIILKSDNYYFPKDNNNYSYNKNIKTESNNRKLKMSNNYKNINIKREQIYKNNTNTNSKIITLTEEQLKKNRKYYNYNNCTYNKNAISSKGKKNNIKSLKQNKTTNKVNDYLPNYNGNTLNQKNNLKQIIKNNNNYNKNLNIKEKNIPKPLPSYHKLTILNKISEAKKGMKNILMSEANFRHFYNNNKYKYKQMVDINQTNDETNQTNNQNDLLSKDNILKTINISNTVSADEDKYKLSFIKKKNNYDKNNNKKKLNKNKKILVKNKKVNKKETNESINKIDSFAYNGQKIENINLNSNKNSNNYIISPNEFNEYHANNGKAIRNKNKEDKYNEDNDISIQSLSDSKVLEIANTYVNEHVDKTQVDEILTYKRKKNPYSYYE